MAQRVVLRRHCHYNTKSNKQRVVKTPGGRLVVQRRVKVAQVPKCGDCKRKLAGIAAVRPHLYKTLKKRERTVSRAYGGVRCHTCVKDRIIRAFLKEEQKLLKKAVEDREASKKSKEESKASAPKKSAKAEGDKENKAAKKKSASKQ